MFRGSIVALVTPMHEDGGLDGEAFRRLIDFHLIAAEFAGVDLRIAHAAEQDAGVEVRKIWHRLRHQAIEPFNGLFKNIFEWGGQVPVKGLRRTRLIVLGAVFIYQLVLFYQFQHGLPLGQAIKPFLRAA